MKYTPFWKELILEGIVPQNGMYHVAQVKIKIEVDREPPLGFETEVKLLLKPFSI